MSLYRLGIMTHVWLIEAPDVDTAVVALRLWGQYATIPIANLSNDERSRFSNLMEASNADLAPLHDFIKANAPYIKEAVKSIEKEQ